MARRLNGGGEDLVFVVGHVEDYWGSSFARHKNHSHSLIMTVVIMSEWECLLKGF